MQETLFDVAPEYPDGFTYKENFISEQEEKNLSHTIQKLSFSEVKMHGVVAKRRTIHFGVSYNYDTREILPGSAIPSFLLPLRKAIAHVVALPDTAFSEALLTQYTPGAVIGWHADAPAFGIVIGISLGSSCVFRLRRAKDPKQKLQYILQPRSMYIMQGRARWEWQHSIPAVKQLRYSITFRTIKHVKNS